jgi:hypothetical protein
MKSNNTSEDCLLPWQQKNETFSARYLTIARHCIASILLGRDIFSNYDSEILNKWK